MEDGIEVSRGEIMKREQFHKKIKIKKKHCTKRGDGNKGLSKKTGESSNLLEKSAKNRQQVMLVAVTSGQLEKNIQHQYN